MQEDFLWYIWKFKLFNAPDLFTTSGEKIQIIKTGEHNTDAGPDFINARIKIGSTEWAGNIEIHSAASDWTKHNHTNNKTYDNIILHVVHENDKQVIRKNGEEIPTLELKEKIKGNVYEKYRELQFSKDWISCENQISSVSKFTLNNWLDRLMIERLERKSATILESLKQNKNNWEECFYQMLARSFGQKINSDPFELLARSLPYSYLAKHKNSLLQIEAMLFGVAGMLEPVTGPRQDDYYKELQKEFSFLSKKFKLEPLNISIWKFLRLHPVNFPTIRIAQFANLILKTAHLFSKVLEAGSIKTLEALLQTEASTYWNSRYRFGVHSPHKKKKISKDFITNIIINTIVPFLFIYGKDKNNEEYCKKAILFLEQLQSEKNSLLSKWENLGIKAKNAYESQALLQLKNEYCSKKRCLECNIGCALLSNN